MWLDTVRKIRNKLAHATSTTCFDQGRLEKWWSMLEGSVLGLAAKVQPFYVDSIEDQIHLLGKIEFSRDDGEIQNLIKTENKELYDQIIKEHNKSFQQILERQEMHAKDNRDKSEAIKEEIIKHLEQTKDDLSLEIKQLTLSVKLHDMDTVGTAATAEQTETQSEEQMITEVKQEPCENPAVEKQIDKRSQRCQVEWKLRTPDTWNVEHIKQTLENVSGMLRQWFRIEFIYIGSLVINTSVPKHVLRDREILKSAIESFLQNIVEVCEINTDLPETVYVEFRVLDIPPNTETVKSEADRLNKLPQSSDMKSSKEEDKVRCKHCDKEFTCEQCSDRRKQLRTLEEDIKKKIQIIADMKAERLESGDINFPKMVQKSTEYVQPRDKTMKKKVEYSDYHDLSKPQKRLKHEGMKTMRFESEDINLIERLQLGDTTIKKKFEYSDYHDLSKPRKRIKHEDQTAKTKLRDSDYYTLPKSTKTIKQAEVTKPSAKCQLCILDPSPAVYWCKQCVQVMCKQCNTVHREQPTSSTHTTTLFSSDYNFKIKGIVINDIASLCAGRLIICDDHGKS